MKCTQVYEGVYRDMCTPAFLEDAGFMDINNGKEK